MTPDEALQLQPAGCYVVIDALRATTTMAVLFHRGLETLRVVDDIPAGRAVASESETLLFGEEGGFKPTGFDYGNSPAEAMGLNLAGRHAVHVTSNGTKALCAVAAHGIAVAGALVNLSAGAGFASGFERTVFVCAGNGGARRFALEDFAVAAAFVQLMRAGFPDCQLGDGALLALQLEDPDALIARSRHAAITRELGFGDDIAIACRRDAAPSLPVVAACGPGWALLRDNSIER